MSKNIKYQYLQKEKLKKISRLVKTEKRLIKPGKSMVFNMFQRAVTNPLLMKISESTIVVVIFDTDLISPNMDMFLSNISKLSKSRTVKKKSVIDTSM